MKLTPTQELLLEVLGARYRTGETLWTFDSKHKRKLEQLADMGLVNVMHGMVENSCRASLTEEGMKLVIDPVYVPPILR